MTERRLPVSPEIERLLNPAYCAAILATHAAAYRVTTLQDSGVPYLMTFLTLPLCIHEPTQQAIVAHNETFSLHRLAADHPDVLFGLDERVCGYSQLTRTSLLFGANHNMLLFDRASATWSVDARVEPKLSGSLARTPPFRAARRLGSWFARTTVVQSFLDLMLTP